MKAVILCAGYGTRLGNLTKHIPKPMIDIDGLPLLHRTILYLKQYGFYQIGINLSYMPDVITEYCGKGEKFGVDLCYSYEKEPLGTAGALKKISKWLSDSEDFLVIYGDILTNQNLTDLYEFHVKKQAFATLVLHKRENSNSIVIMDEHGQVIRFMERPDEEEKTRYINENTETWVNSGIQMLNKRVFWYIPDNQSFDLPRDVYTKATANEKIYGFSLQGIRIAIDSIERYKLANETFLKKADEFYV